MSEPKPHQQYIARDLTLTEWKLILRIRGVDTGIINVEKDGDMLRWSVGGFWEIPTTRVISASLPVEISVT